MATDRIRRVYSKREMEGVVDDFVTQGYEVLSRGESTISIRQNPGWGGVGAHIIIFIVTCWSFGVGNLFYALYKRYTGEKVLVKLDTQE